MRLIPVLLLIAACNGPTKGNDSNVTQDSTIVTGETDADGDGILSDMDCDDSNATIGAAGLWYGDADTDGHGNAGIVVTACEAPDGFLDTADDCDDLNATVYPGAAEIFDNADNDCDGLTDDADDNVDASTGTAFYPDADGDTYGDGTAAQWACAASTGMLEDNSDCDDTNPAIQPGAAEICDGADNDCEGSVDVDALDEPLWGLDADQDSYGDESTA